MKQTIVRLIITACAAAATTVVVMAFSTGPPIKRTGAAVDGGTDCSVCHTTFAPANSDPRGKVTIIAASAYVPGQKQNIDIKIDHPTALRWGFQLTARPVNDLTKMAGTFTSTNVIRVMQSKRRFTVQWRPGICRTPLGGRNFVDWVLHLYSGMDSANQ